MSSYIFPPIKEQPVIDLVERCLIPVIDNPSASPSDITKALNDVAKLHALTRFNSGLLQQPCLTLNKDHIRTVLTYDKDMQALLVSNQQYVHWLVDILLHTPSLEKWEATFMCEDDLCIARYAFGLLFKDNQLLLPLCCVLAFVDS